MKSFISDITISLVEINQKIQDHIKMLTDLKDLRLKQVSSYYLKLKEYSEQLEWTPPSSSTIEYLLFEKFDRCLTADCLNEIENTIHHVIHSLFFFFFLYKIFNLVGKSNRSPKNSLFCIT